MIETTRPFKLLIFDWEGTLADPNYVYPTRLFPHTQTVLSQLHQQGYLLAIATAKSKAGLLADLKHTEIEKFIHTTCTAEESAAKPSPEMLFIILDRLAIAAQDALMIGDTFYDLTMAQRAKMSALAISSGMQTREELLKYQPLDCIDTLTQLPDWLTQRKR